MRSSFLTLLAALAAASSSSASVVKRQVGLNTPSTLHAIAGGVDLGALHAGPVVIVSNSTAGSLFYVDELQGELFEETLSDISPAPHAFLDFTGSSTASCGTTGPMVFAEAAADLCAVGTGFKFVGNTLEVGLLGTFQVCNEQIYFAKTPGPTPVQPLSDAAASCVNVTIEKPTVATAVPLA